MTTIPLNEIVLSAAIPYLAGLPLGLVDLVLTDPPFGIKYKTRRNKRSGQPRATRGSFGPDLFDASWLPQSYRVTKEGGALYLFTHWLVLNKWLDAVYKSGWQYKQIIVWDKLHWTSGDLRYYGNQTEVAIFATKGTHSLNWGKREGNVWQVPTISFLNNEGNYDNPTQKPEELLERPIERSSLPGQIVLDPFAGSGSTAATAYRLGRNFLTCEIDPYQYGVAQERLSRVVIDPVRAGAKPMNKSNRKPIRMITNKTGEAHVECPYCGRDAEKGFDPNLWRYRFYHYGTRGRVLKSDFCESSEPTPPKPFSFDDYLEERSHEQS